MKFMRKNRQAIYDYINNADTIDYYSIITPFRLAELGALILNHNTATALIQETQTMYDSWVNEYNKSLEMLNVCKEKSLSISYDQCSEEYLNLLINSGVADNLISHLENIISETKNKRAAYKQEIIDFLETLED